MILSFIMPIYNAQSHLREAIDSVVNQAHGDWELLLIDDGSTDASGAICEEYAQQDSRIRVFHLENGGVSRARNYGLERVNGEYIAFVDSDDLLAPDYIETVLPCLPDCDWLVFGLTTFPKNQPCRISEKQIFQGAAALKEAYLSLSTVHLFNSPCNKVYRTALIAKTAAHFPEDLSLGEDLLFNLQYGNACRCICAIPDTLYHYRVDGESSLSKRFRTDYFEIQKRLKTSIDTTFSYQSEVLSKTERALFRGGIEQIKSIIYQENLSFFQKRAQILSILEDEMFAQASGNHSMDLSGYLLKKKMVSCIMILGTLKKRFRKKTGRKGIS